MTSESEQRRVEHLLSWLRWRHPVLLGLGRAEGERALGLGVLALLHEVSAQLDPPRRTHRLRPHRLALGGDQVMGLAARGRDGRRFGRAEAAAAGRRGLGLGLGLATALLRLGHHGRQRGMGMSGAAWHWPRRRERRVGEVRRPRDPPARRRQARRGGDGGERRRQPKGQHRAAVGRFGSWAKARAGGAFSAAGFAAEALRAVQPASGVTGRRAAQVQERRRQECTAELF